MSRKVAEFSVDISPSLVNDSLDELFGSADDTSVENIDQEPEEVEQDVDTTEDTEDTTDTTPEPVEQDEPEQDTDDDPYKDYSNVSLLALALKDVNSELVPDEIKKDMTPKELLESLQTNLDKLIENKTQEIEDRYEGAASYLSLLIKGVNVENVQYGLKLRQIGDIQLDEDTSEEDLEYIVNEGFLQKGIEDEEERKDMIEALKDKGKLYDRAEKVIEHFKNLETTYIANLKKQRDEEERVRKTQQLETKKAVQAVIDKGVAKGLPIKDKKKLLDSIYNLTEPVEYIDPSGKKVVEKISLYQAKQNAFNQDIEQQIAFAQLLLDGFDFTEVVKVAKKSVNEEIIRALDKKETTKTNNKVSRNPWYDL
jgi:hypothetical protein